jgi:uncharacterized membrane protein/glutaredoxin
MHFQTRNSIQSLFRRASLALIPVLVITAVLFTTVYARSGPPIVYGVLFYSPSCPHCHEVINTHWPGIEAEFGDQLRVLFVDVTGRQGGQLMLTAIRELNIDSNAVPMLIIGSEVMVGSRDIPERAPAIIREGLAAGGIGIPNVSGLPELFERVFAEAAQSSETESVQSKPLAEMSLTERLAADPVANGMAVFVLLILVASLGGALYAGWRLLVQKDETLLQWISGQPGWLLSVIIAVTGVGASITLIAEQSSQPFVTPLAAVVLVALLAALVSLLVSPRAVMKLPNWMLPVVTIAGIGVAAYLAHIEVSQAEAYCGLVGNCNVVQQSLYARLFGVLPIGILGIVGYLAILLIWLVKQFGSQHLAATSQAGLLVMSLFGVAFSIYLTFLEPFIIGATCIWCLTSAIIMVLVMWLVVNDGWQALYKRSTAKA